MDSGRAHITGPLRGAAAVVILAALLIAATQYAPQNPYTPATAHASIESLTGYAWSDNVGWISFSGTAADSSSYGVSVNNDGTLGGYAWSDNIGWINFGTNSCGAQATMANGALTGWAQAIANGGGWDGCIKLADSAAPAYGPTLTGSDFDGFAWGSDTVGWISFNCATGGPTTATQQKIFITAGSSWTVPTDWNSANNTVEVIGGGGGGRAGQPAPAYSGGGGGGGAYAKRTNVALTPGASVAYRVGPAGAAAVAGGDTYFCNASANCASIAGTAVVAGAKGGNGASSGSGAGGGATAQSIGDAGAVFAGGNGGGGWAGGGGGGGGAAGPSGQGGRGGSMVASAYGGGGGGGANNGANAANTAANNNGTAGGHNASGVGGGAGGTASVAGSPGSSGGGGGGGGGNSGASGAPGGAGGAGTTWTATNVWNGSAYTGATPTSGPGGGGGGGGGAGPGAASYGASGASYGAGGGGGGTGTSNGAGAAGAQGLIVISYTPAISINICATSNYKVSYSGPTTAPTCTLSVTPNPAGAGWPITIAYTTTNNPSTGTIYDPSNNVITTTATAASGNIAATAPSTVGSYAYDMTVASPVGSNTCTSPSLTVQLDKCTDISGIQQTLPTGCTGPVPSPSGVCIPSGYMYHTSLAQCIPTTPLVFTFTGGMTRKGNTGTLTYTVYNPNGACSITGSNGFSTSVTPTDGVQGTVTTNAINARTEFIMTCDTSSRSTTIGTTPTFQEY